MTFLRTVCLLAVLTIAVGTLAQASGGPPPATAPQAQPSPQPAPTIASITDRQVSQYEKLVVEAAEAMPADKFDFTPESLNIKGAEFKGVRTFATLIKHTATANFFYWSAVTGDKPPANIKGPNGPEELKTKAEIIQFLKDSFAVGHRAATSLTGDNVVELVPFRNNKAPGLCVVTGAVIHCGDEYGQVVEYLRMNGIVPPASQSH